MIVKCHVPVEIDGKIIQSGVEFEATQQRIDKIRANSGVITIVKADPKPKSTEKKTAKPKK